MSWLVRPRVPSRAVIRHCAAILGAFALAAGSATPHAMAAARSTTGSSHSTAVPTVPTVKPVPMGTNLLANPGFEESVKGQGWMPAAWDTFQSGLQTVFFGRDTFLVHSGRYAVNVASVSSRIPMWHNWSQTVLVGKEAWGKEAVFTIWTRSNGVQGRGYVLLQAYRDTVEKMARLWGVSHDSSMVRLGILPTSNPYMNLGWKRAYFSDVETDWVQRQVKVFVAPSTNVLIVRCGIFGVGQVLFDDASLALQEPEPIAQVPLHTNLLQDPGFEGNGDAWEYSMPPYLDMVVERDSTVSHSGKASVRMSGGTLGMIQTRAGVCQMVANPNLAGKRLRLTGWVKTDNLKGLAYVMIYCTTPDGDVHESTPRQFGDTTDWTKAVMEVDAPPGTLGAWAWFVYNAPAAGEVHFDDVSLEAIGDAAYVRNGEPPPKPAALPGR